MAKIANINHNGKKPAKVVPQSGVKKSSALDTLAQLATFPHKTDIQDDLNLSPSTSQDDRKTLLKRARRKFFTNGFVTRLADAAKKNASSTLGKSYWRSYHCAGNLTTFSDGSVLGHYCKTRWCMVCNAIRTAQSINTYVPVIRTWKDARFCTATRVNVSRADLYSEVRELHKLFIQIKRSISKRHERGTIDFKLVGVRKFECTYNAISDTYHPHFHVIFQSEKMALAFMAEWMKRNKKQGKKIDRKAQDVRPVDENSLCELFKYMTKVVSKTGKGHRVIFADSMDLIFNAMAGKRVMQNFGFKLPKIDEKESESSARGMAFDTFKWQQSCADWVNPLTGELLSGYKPGEAFKDFVNKRIIVR